MVMSALWRTLVRLSKAFSTCSAMFVVVGGAPSSPTAVWPEHNSTCEAPDKSTACENPKAFDHSHGLTSVRSMFPPDRLSPPKHTIRLRSKQDERTGDPAIEVANGGTRTPVP